MYTYQEKKPYIQALPFTATTVKSAKKLLDSNNIPYLEVHKDEKYGVYVTMRCGFGTKAAYSGDYIISIPIFNDWAIMRKKDFEKKYERKNK